MDLNNFNLTLPLHRSRFLDLIPSNITALAYPPPPVDNNFNGFPILAVGKSNGDIEIKQFIETPKGNSYQQPGKGWLTVKVLPALLPSGKVNSLHFVKRHPAPVNSLTHGSYSQAITSLNPYTSNHLRLFSSTGSSTLIEWCLDSGRVKNSINSDGGAIWSVTLSPSNQQLAIGCADGRIRLVDLSHGQFNNYRMLSHVPTRLLSLSWSKNNEQPISDNDDDVLDELKYGWLVAGCSDSSLRIYNLQNGRVHDRLSVDKLKSEHTLVWTVNVLDDNTIVSGDSLGNVIFWDSKTSTQISSFKSHQADVLTSCVSADGKTVFTSGIDQRVSQFTSISINNDHSNDKFIQSASRRLHTHDVNALAVWPPQATPYESSLSKQCPILASGGIDPHLNFTPCYLPSTKKDKKKLGVIANYNPVSTSLSKNFNDSYNKRMPYVPINSPNSLSVCRSRRWILARRDKGISVWKVKSFDESDGEGGYEKVLETEFKFKSHLISHSISPNGSTLAVSDAYETKLFYISENPPIPKKLKLGINLPSANSIMFTPDSKRLILASSSTASILVYELIDEGISLLKEWNNKSKARNIRNIPNRKNNKQSEENKDNEEMEVDEINDDDHIEATIHSLSCSVDGQWLSVVDFAKRLQLYNLDSLQHHATLPSLSHLPSSLQFHPTLTCLLIIGLPNNLIQFYDVETKSQPSWAKAINENTMFDQYVELLDPMQGLIINPNPHALPPNIEHVINSNPTLDPLREERLITYGASWMCVIHFKTDNDHGIKKLSKTQKRKHRRQQSQQENNANNLKNDFGEPLINNENSYNIINRYSPIALADFIGPGELVVIERPQNDFVDSLPPAFFKHKYGLS